MRFLPFGVALASLLIATGAVAQNKRTFGVQNRNSTVSVQQVWTAAAGTREVWDESDLNGPIPPGQSMTFTLSAGNTCFLDVKVRFSDGYEQSFANVNACRADQVIAR